MKKNTFRRQVVLVVWMLLCGLSAQAADEDLITQQDTTKEITKAEEIRKEYFNNKNK